MQSFALEHCHAVNGRSQPPPITVVAFEYSDNHAIEMHRHRRGQLIFAIRGVMELATDRGLWLVPPQRALWMPPNIDHRMRAQGRVSLRTVYVRSNFVPDYFPEQPRSVQVSPLFRELILRGSQIKGGGNLNRRDALILALLLEEIQWAPESGLYLPSGHDKRIMRICEAILRDPGNNHSLEYWGREVGASTRTLSRIFQLELGVSFITWRQQARILAALPRLANGEPITTIAADLGYDTTGAFSTMFRRLMGCMPSKYFPIEK